MKMMIALMSLLALLTITSVVQAQAAALQLGWVDNSNNEDGFKIERCTGANCTTFTQVGTTGANIVVYSDPNLPERTTFGYRVRAFNTAGDSAYTNIAYGTTPATIPNAPTGLGVK